MKSLFSKDLLEQLKGNNSSPVVQFVKYAIAGGLATLIHIVLFHFFAWKIFPSLQEGDIIVALLELSVTRVDVTTRSLNSMLSNGTAFIWSSMVAYITNIYWVFEPGRHGKFVEISLFYLVSGISMTLGTCIMGFLIQYFGVQTTIAFTANIVTAVMMNYTIRKFYIFKG